MDCPPPLTSPTPILDSNEDNKITYPKIINKKEYELNFNNIKYNLQIQTDLKYIYFRLIELKENKIPLSYYKNKFDLKSIIHLLRVLPDIYNDLNKIMELLNFSYFNNKLQLSIKNNNINIIVKIINGYTEIECPIKLNEEKININDKIELILNDIIYLKNNKNKLLTNTKLLEIENILKDIQFSTKRKLQENEDKIKILNQKNYENFLKLKNNEETIIMLKNKLFQIENIINNFKINQNQKIKDNLNYNQTTLSFNRNNKKNNNIKKDNNQININNNNKINNFQQYTNINISKDKYYNKDLTSIKQLNYVPMIGLENLGETSYMNSVLQCFSNLYFLTNYFLNPSKQEYIKINTITKYNPNANSLSVAYKELIDNL